MTRLEQPSVAINDPRLRSQFRMWRSYDLESENVSRQHIIDRIVVAAGQAEGGRIRNLVLHCHGNPGFLQLGEGFEVSHLSSFNICRDKVEKIWITACQAARGQVGYWFCSTLAQIVHCYVVVSTESQVHAIRTFPLNYISSFEGLLLCFEPEHGNISWSHRYPSTWQDRNGRWHRTPD